MKIDLNYLQAQFKSLDKQRDQEGVELLKKFVEKIKEENENYLIDYHTQENKLLVYLNYNKKIDALKKETDQAIHDLFDFYQETKASLVEEIKNG